MAKAKTPTPIGQRIPTLGGLGNATITAERLETAWLRELAASNGTSKQALWGLARLYGETGRRDDALACVERLARLSTRPDEVASCHLAQGQLSEQAYDYKSAVRHYRAGLALGQQQAPTWYWIHNNLGYSLVQLGQYHEAAAYLHVAVAVDPTRPNAFKNLGLAMLGINENVRAAEWFVIANRANPGDRRSLMHLERLVASHPELTAQIPTLQGELDACRRGLAS